MTKSQSAPNGSAPNGSKTGIWERPERQGLFDPAFERDACGVGFIADMKGRKSHKIVEDALQILENLEHRGAVGADPLSGDGAGILIQIPHAFLREEAAKLGIHAAGARPLCGGPCVHAARRAPAPPLRARVGTLPERRGPGTSRLALRARRQRMPVRHGALDRARPPSGVRQAPARPCAIRTISSASCTLPARWSRTRSSTPTRAATSATTPYRCRAGRSSTRACSSRIR